MSPLGILLLIIVVILVFGGGGLFMRANPTYATSYGYGGFSIVGILLLLIILHVFGVF